MTEFNYEQFSDDFNYAVDKIKEIIDINAKNINTVSKDDTEQIDYQQNIEKGCVCLINLYLTSSKIYENLGKTAPVKKEDDKKPTSANKQKLDNLFG